MGKYMRKAKITGDVAAMEVSHSSIGVRTRAKTLALQRLQPPPSSSNPESSYLQLRNRRLEKPPLLSDAKKESCRRNPSPDRSLNHHNRPCSRLRLSSVNSGSVGSFSISCSNKEDGLFGNKAEETEDNYDFGIEASFGENNLEFEVRERSTRESTPCSFIRDSDTIGTPGSATGPITSNAANRRTRNAMQRNIPTTREMDEFFAFAEQQQQRLFIEKYNFDIVNDLPLPGRYEWVRVGL